jgi:hypothetical protein
MEGRNEMTIKGRRGAKTAIPIPPVALAYTQYPPPPWAYPLYVVLTQGQLVQERTNPLPFERESQPPLPSSPIREYRDVMTGLTDIITQFGEWVV